MCWRRGVIVFAGSAKAETALSPGVASHVHVQRWLGALTAAQITTDAASVLVRAEMRGCTPPILMTLLEQFIH